MAPAENVHPESPPHLHILKNIKKCTQKNRLSNSKELKSSDALRSLSIKKTICQKFQGSNLSLTIDLKRHKQSCKPCKKMKCVRVCPKSHSQVSPFVVYSRRPIRATKARGGAVPPYRRSPEADRSGHLGTQLFRSFSRGTKLVTQSKCGMTTWGAGTGIVAKGV